MTLSAGKIVQQIKVAFDFHVVDLVLFVSLTYCPMSVFMNDPEYLQENSMYLDHSELILVHGLIHGA